MRNRSFNNLGRFSIGRSLFVLATLILLAAGLLLLDRAGYLAPVRSRAEVIINPALDGLSRASERVSTLGRELTEVQQLREQLTALQAENSRLRAENITAQTLIQENQALRRQLRLEQENPWKLVGAGVLAYSPDAGRNTLRLAVGSDNGVRRGMAVVAQEGDSPPALIGTVEEVSETSAVVLLITDFSSALSVHVYHQGNLMSGMLQGQWQRGSRLRLDQVERTLPLAPGDPVVTAGLSATLAPGLPSAEVPRNVPIGTIEVARVDGTMQVAEVRPFIDPARVTYAWVILSADAPKS